jgi:hypothetical protein
VKLTICRNQADVKGVFGGHKGVSFSLFGKCAVSDAERALIERYKVGDYVLASYAVPTRGEPYEFKITVNNLISGSTHNANDIGTLLKLEEEMKTGCNNLKNLLVVMNSFGGEQTFEI